MERSDALLVRHCSPTLMGLKTGSLFTCPVDFPMPLTDRLRRWNRLLGCKGLRVLPLRIGEKKALILVYRARQLQEDLTCPPVVRLLRECGYEHPGTAAAIARLRRRLAENATFPHEIGLFLGYPPEDVRGFIEHRAQHFRYAGCWKVYGDEEAAKRRFLQYRQCTARCCRAYARGQSLEQLATGKEKIPNA